MTANNPNEYLFRVSHQAEYGNPESEWHSVLFLYLCPYNSFIVHSRAYVCELCKRWKSYNPRMATRLKRDYRELWDYWQKSEKKKRQKTLEGVFQALKDFEQKTVPVLWLDDGDSYPVIVEDDSQWDTFFVRSNTFSGWEIVWVECKTSYGLPLRIYMSKTEFNQLRRNVRGHAGEVVEFTRLRRNNVRNETSVNEAAKRKADADRAAIAAMFPEEKSMPLDK